MKEYSFYYDQKGTIWERTYFTIDAKDQEEANKKALEYIEGTEDSNDDSEYLSETFIPMTAEENGGNSTYELYTNNGNMKFKNGI
jgi:hypothetical protein